MELHNSFIEGDGSAKSGDCRDDRLPAWNNAYRTSQRAAGSRRGVGLHVVVVDRYYCHHSHHLVGRMGLGAERRLLVP
jgi:hypothetical protein